MSDLHSKTDIEKISFDLLKQSKALDVFPTPVDNIISYTNLYLNTNVNLSKVEESFLSKFSGGILEQYKESIGLIRGFLDRKDKTIYLDLSQPTSRKTFIKLHETGHEVLPWQGEIMQCLDDDNTLDFHTREEFEAEANYFASITLFQHDRFNYEMDKLEIGMKAPMYLARKFGGSNHAALRKYVECSTNRCALLVLEKISNYREFAQCHKKDFFHSESFQKTFGNVVLPDKFGYTWQFTQDYYFNKKYHEKGQISLSTENGEADFNYHFFNNTYNAFVFLIPHGETKTVKSKIVLVNSDIL